MNSNPSESAESGAANKPKSISTIATWIVLGAIIAAGTIFRFANLDQKVFWFDEVVTRRAISGTTDNFEYGRVYSKAEFVQSTGIDKRTSVVDVVKNIAMTQAEQTPVYYALERLWSRLVGETPLQLRLFSAVVGVLLIAATYLLGAELFGSTIAGGIAAALTAVSPFCLDYAQEARPYALWALGMVLSSVTLLRALRAPTTMRWLRFFLALTFTTYTHLLSATYVVAICIWMLWQKKTRFNKGFLDSHGP